MLYITTVLTYELFIRDLYLFTVSKTLITSWSVQVLNMDLIMQILFFLNKIAYFREKIQNTT